MSRLEAAGASGDTHHGDPYSKLRMHALASVPRRSGNRGAEAGVEAGARRAATRPAARRAWLLAALSLALAAPAPAQERFVGTPVTFYDGAGGERPDMPTGIAVRGDGVVFVADGVRDRILIFDPTGQAAGEIRAAGEQNLSRPVAVKTDSLQRLWIADTGNRRVVVLDAAGELLRALPLPQDGAAHPADATDLALDAAGEHLWVVDNDNHRLLRCELASGAWRTFGQRGESLGQFQYPYMLALGRGGDVVVTDVINARVQILSRDGAPVGSAASYGVELGQVYRPTGIAIDAQGNLWVADSVIGVVQVFRPNGGPIDVLRDAGGAPYRFASPMGLAFDAEGDLYVCELRADRISRLRITREASTTLPPPPQRPSLGVGQQARACTVCHVDWLPVFAEGRDSSLMPRPVGRADEPVVARSDMCLSCHDTSVADSRFRVWEEHGHRTDVPPPESMTVPATLPLVDGKIACRTCHSAHGPGVAPDDISKVVLLRMRNVASELCMTCHVDKTRGARFGTHPTGGMPWPVPQELVDAGARLGPDPRELTCQVCHTPHGARHDHLLVMGTGTNQLCLTCHDQMRPGMFRPGGESEHPLSPKVNAEQAQAIRDLGTRLSPQGELICLSCHKLHHGLGQRFLLADDLHDGQMCLHCHSERTDMLRSAHDLRESFPNERNRLGMTVSEGGPCSACHLFHRYARQPTPTPLDPRGQCVTCHQPGQCGERKVLGPVNHPELACTDCHNPHVPRYGHFLHAPAEVMCRACHEQQARLVGGAHDATVNPNAWDAWGDVAQDRCLVCHRPHGDERTRLFRVAPEEGVAHGDAACIACHTHTDWGRGELAALHTRVVPPGFAPRGAESLGFELGQPGFIHCTTCHDPHSGGGRCSGLPSLAGGGADLPCLVCHTQHQFIGSTGHSIAVLSEKGLATSGCQPCHVVHGDASKVESRLMRPAALLVEGVVNTDLVAQVGDAYCLACHATGGPAPPPVTASHPNVAMFDPAAEFGMPHLPLYDERGEVTATGFIACRTCHDPHGRPAPQAEVIRAFPLHVDAIRAQSANEPPRVVDPNVPLPPWAAAERRTEFARLQLRPFQAPNVCTSCHGADALRRYLFFHDPRRRTGAVTSVGPPQ